MPPSNHVDFLPPTLSPHFHIFQAFFWAHQNTQWIKSIHNPSEIRQLMHYELLVTTRVPPNFVILQVWQFPKKLASLVKFTLVMGNNWGTWNKKHSLKISQFFVKKWQNLLGKKPLIATSLVVILPPEHIRCVETLSHKTCVT